MSQVPLTQKVPGLSKYAGREPDRSVSSEANKGARSSVYDFFVTDPVSFWTGKDPKEVKALDALPVYAGAAFWPLALLGLAGCADQGGDEDAGDVDEIDRVFKLDVINALPQGNERFPVYRHFSDIR